MKPLKVDEVRGTKIYYFSQPIKANQNQLQFAPNIVIEPPYVSSNVAYEYDDSEYLKLAKKYWQEEALDRIHPTASVIVLNGQVIGHAGNGKFLETADMCERIAAKSPSGQDYHLCQGNHHSDNHSEGKASRPFDGGKAKGATLYLYGHWWPCEPCATSVESAGIDKIVMSRQWTKGFLGIKQ